MADFKLTGYGTPAFGMGIIGEHTYVVSCNFRWGCGGISSGGRHLISVQGNENKANCLAQPNHMAGIPAHRYFREGICHQRANRILSAANANALISNADKYFLYAPIFGPFGKAPRSQNFRLYTLSNPWPEKANCDANHTH